MKRKAIALLSGGLDSSLALKLILDQGIEVEAVNFITVFCTCNRRGGCIEAKKVTDEFGAKLKVFHLGDDYLQVVKNPKHGRGKNVNPCIDCRIFMFRKAREYMNETGASFIVTGEVLGERPMSQNLRAMRMIEKEAGVEGLVVRPLSARRLKVSLPEEEGWVDREKLLDICGRSRTPQIALAKEVGLENYLCASGGCLLTDPGFSRRLKDLLTYGELTLHEARLLKLGRHFRLTDKVKIIVGRDDAENKELSSLAEDEDVWFEAADYPGPLTLYRGPAAEELIKLAAAVTARYSKARDLDKVKVEYGLGMKDGRRSIWTAPIELSQLEKYRI